jgi:hypothetical protein
VRRPRITRQWRSRVLGGALLGAIGYVAASLLDFDPQPLAYVLWAAVVLTVAWLVVDTVEVPQAQWVPALPPPGDRIDEATSDLRIISSHQQATHPSPAVRNRLVALARARDPELAETLSAELDVVRRLSPADIDRILTRIEDVRDRP